MFTNYLKSCLDAWDNNNNNKFKRTIGFMLQLVYVFAICSIILAAAYIFS